MKRFLIIILPWFYKFFIGAILTTCRIRFVGSELVEQLKQQGNTWIYTCWHENTAITVWAERNNKIAMMASDSKDGEIIARGIELVGNLPVRGSSSKGGAKAAKAMVKYLKSGHSAAITPDGPRGPVRQMQPGVLYISAMSGSPIVPYHAVANRQWTFTSWDKHRIPKPFSKVIISIGEPYFVDRQQLKENEGAILKEVEERMMQNVENAQLALEKTA